MPTISSDEKLAILAVDPGQTTGVAAAYVPKRATLKESLLASTNKKAIEVKGNWLDQAGALSQIMRNFVFKANVEAQIAIPNIHIVLEDFVLRRKREGGATGNLTSCWVAAGAVALFSSYVLIIDATKGKFDSVQANQAGIHWQQPSQAKGKATNDRLKLWGLYEAGSEHRKDAWRHLATLADHLI